MKTITTILTLLFITTLCLIPLYSCTPRTVVFENETCIIPFQGYTYKTCADINVLVDNQLFTIPEGFKTDLASIPRPLWSFIAPQYTGYVPPAILHDYLYRCDTTVSRKFADETLFSALLQQDVGKYTAGKFYLGVRLFGWSHFSNSNECEK